MSEERLEAWLASRLGLQVDRAMRERLRHLATAEAARRGLDVDAYAGLVGEDEDARRDLVDRLLVPTTAFFRHPRQFEVLRTRMADWRDPLTIWSAGCSTGAEPYTIAMVLRESGRRDWRVVASDMSSSVLERAAGGVFNDDQVADLGPDRRTRHLEPAPGGWRVAGPLRDRVVFLRHNLATDDVPAAARGARAVFCRNVLIYLRPDAQAAFLERLERQVPALELLFLGATESLLGVTRRFAPVRAEAAYAYRPASRAEPAPAGPARRAAPQQADRPPARGAGGTGDAGAHLAAGHAALAAGRTAAAVAAFRRACYLDADDPVARVSLALALEAAGHEEARDAFAAARAALTRRAAGLDEIELDGLRGSDLARLIDHRLARLA